MKRITWMLIAIVAVFTLGFVTALTIAEHVERRAVIRAQAATSAATTIIVFLLILILALILGAALALMSAFQPRATAGPVAITPLPPVVEPDGRAGACYSFYYDPPSGPDRPFIPMAHAAGSRWDRFDFVWPNIEPANDNWEFAAYDTLVNDLHAADMRIVGILLWTPDWAATSGLNEGASKDDVLKAITAKEGAVPKAVSGARGTRRRRSGCKTFQLSLPGEPGTKAGLGTGRVK